MKKLLLSGLCCAGLIALLPDTGRAHGGQYRGPGDVVPPGPGGGGRTGGPGGPTTGGPGAPSAPAPGGPATGGPAGPTTGGPAAPGGAPGGPTTGGGGGGPPPDDLTQWNFWWEFNKDPFIRLREEVLQGGPQTGSDDFYLGQTRRSDAKDSMRPTDAQIQNEILPALKKAVDSTDQRDINSSCMIAMAKIGADHADFKLRDVFVPRLKRGDSEIRETAALSLGIAAIAGEEEVKLLCGLVRDKDPGRAAYGGEIDPRTRSFAAYGLGLTANKTTKLEIKREAFEALKEILADKKISVRDIKVAAINGMATLNIGQTSDAEKALLNEVVDALKAYYMEPLGSGEQLIQAHCPPAIARLIGRNHPRADEFKELFAADIEEKGKVKRSSIFIPQSCVLALGRLTQPFDDKDDKKYPDNRYSKLLLDTWNNHKDVQTRNFTMISLAYIGGKENLQVMLKLFPKVQKNQERPWVALGLGLYQFFQFEAGKTDPETIIAETLSDELKKQKEPSIVGALAIALGLSRSLDAADEMRSRMRDNIEREDMAGYLCIGLALMKDSRAIEEIRNILPKAARRFTLLQQAAIALGKLGDKRVAEDL